MNKINLTNDVLAQFGHFCVGQCAIFWFVVVFAWPGWLSAIATLGFAALKEAWWDPRYETEETAGSGLEDFAFWALGVAVAIIGLYLKATWNLIP